ncbi:hypothetical protein JOF56_008127 [Kibdelosporangium banguiense]|uniref:SMI1/KNR4 family protein n=1 Tax=Kibdelosporangium banguiense TaxID=1365924 RepID=A0ABS4TTK6_9PSEU|nr:hypothetical protein [Kibdelosporangium banguiense]MBP2327742.1 hypothetical protein [Kibdelosporangium banguiense]
MKDQAWLDLLATDRIAAMREFLLTWYPGPPPEAARMPGVPAALAELYAIAAGRPQVLGEQNSIYPPDRLRTDPHEGLLVFAAENQGNLSWMIDPAEDDPAVWVVSDGVAPVAERESLSGFLIQFCLLEAIMSAAAQAFCWSASAALADQVITPLREVPLEPWQWPGDPTRFYVTSDLVVSTSHNGPDDVGILAGARSPDALSSLAATDVRWDHGF